MGQMDAPFGFKVDLDRDLFALDRLDDLLKRAPVGKTHIRAADPGKERTGEPEDVTLQGPLADEMRKRPLHVSFQDVTDWAPEYEAQRERVLDAAGTDRSQKLYNLTTNIRVFSGEAPVSLHADGETQHNCGLGGRSVWHFYAPSALSQEEHEALLRGGQFLRWRELTPFKSFDLGIGDACAAPPRWPHWLEHPGDEPAVSFEVGYWTAEAIRERKVYEVNWLLRKAPIIQPTPPNVSPQRDRMKQKVFDAISLATRKGAEYRGV
jgi:hypothetical protein